MPKYTDEDIRKLNKITLKIAGDYLGISSQAVAIGLRNNLLPIGFAIHNEERDRRFTESWLRKSFVNMPFSLFRKVLVSICMTWTEALLQIRNGC